MYLSTNHLVPFASAGNDECAFCFDVTRPTAAGEATPDFEDFTTWLEWVAGELTAGREPAHSFPSAFYKMPGRAG